MILLQRFYEAKDMAMDFFVLQLPKFAFVCQPINTKSESSVEV